MARCILEFLEVRSDLAEVDFLGYVHHALLNKYEHNTMRNIFIRQLTEPHNTTIFGLTNVMKFRKHLWLWRAVNTNKHLCLFTNIFQCQPYEALELFNEIDQT